MSGREGPSTSGNDTVSGDDWLASLGGHLDDVIAEVIGDRHAAAAAPSVDERALLLDLARIAAHGSERWAAPVTTYIVGRRLAGCSDGERRAVLDRLVASLQAAAEG